jgi:CelD/BcsL family acetyltransferase involved in cellulose biosynthesis
MKIETVSAGDLSSDVVSRWDKLLREARELDSPYFRPEFIQAAAAVREGVEIGLIRDGSTITGFFPFERVRRSIARPVGGRLSDYQAVIAPRHAQWNLSELMCGCRLSAWQFDHQLASQQQLAPHFAKVSPSWRIDCSGGYEAYLAHRKAAGAASLSEMLRKSRKLAREHAVRLQWHCAAEIVFNQLLAWKSKQYRNSGLTDLFAQPRIVALIKSIWRIQQPQFAGVLSVLYVDEQPAAIHFGMQSGGLLHSWFPAYDTAWGKFSPGSVLMLQMIEQAAAHGVTCIELGKGDEDYKKTLATGSVPLAEGAVETRRVAAVLRRGWQQTRDWVKQSSLRKPARTGARFFRRMRDWLARA